MYLAPSSAESGFEECPGECTQVSKRSPGVSDTCHQSLMSTRPGLHFETWVHSPGQFPEPDSADLRTKDLTLLPPALDPRECTPTGTCALALTTING